jgi:hypothetical protein
LVLPTTRSSEESVNGVNGASGLGPPGPVGEQPRLAVAEAHRVRLAAAVHLDVQPPRQRVDHGGADAVQAAGRDVRAAAELAAGVQLGEDHLDAGQTGLGLCVDRDAARDVVNLHRPVRVERDVDQVTVAGECLVDGVVDDLPHAVHEPAGVGGPDVHAGPLADCLETLQHGEVPRRVVAGPAALGCPARPDRGRALRWCGAHPAPDAIPPAALLGGRSRLPGPARVSIRTRRHSKRVEGTHVPAEGETVRYGTRYDRNVSPRAGT